MSTTIREGDWLRFQTEELIVECVVKTIESHPACKSLRGRPRPNVTTNHHNRRSHR